jgi:hypothetical protein
MVWQSPRHLQPPQRPDLLFVGYVSSLSGISLQSTVEGWLVCELSASPVAPIAWLASLCDICFA